MPLNVHSVKKDTKRSSNTLLRLVLFFTERTLFLNDSNSLKKNSNIKGGKLDFTSRVIGVCEDEIKS